MRISLRVQFLAPLLGLVFLEAAGTFAAANRAVVLTERQADERLCNAARCFVEPPTFPVTERVLNQLKQLSGADFVAVRPSAAPMTTFSETTEVPTVSGTEPGVTTFRGREYATLGVKLDEPNSGYKLYLFDPVERREAAIRTAVIPVLILGATASLVTILIAAWLGGWVVRRVRRVEAAARRIAGGDFEPTALSAPNDELRDLTRGLNDMAKKLDADRREQTTTERLRILGQFAGGLAHQLRNAAGGARLAVQLHQTRTAENGEALSSALRQLRRMETMLQQFLAVGRAPRFCRAACDPVLLVKEMLELLAPQAKHQRTTLSATLNEPGVNRELDPELFRHIVRNLLQNALEAAGSGGAAGVELQFRPEGVTVIVCDDGRGPPAELAECLFEPFTTGKPEGVGLGLNIVRQAVLAHGGTVGWRREGSQTVFQADLPAQASTRIS